MLRGTTLIPGLRRALMLRNVQYPSFPTVTFRNAAPVRNSQSCLNLDGLTAGGPSSLPENRLLLTPSSHFCIIDYYNTEPGKVKTFFRNLNFQKPLYPIYHDFLFSATTYQKHSRIFLYTALHLHPKLRFTTRKIPHIPDSTSHARLPDRYR